MRNDSLEVEVTVAEVETIANAVRLIRFDVPAGALNLEAGAHVTFELPPRYATLAHDDLPDEVKGLVDRLEAVDVARRRSYSVVDDGTNPERLTIAVRLTDPSRGGSIHMWTLKPGDKLMVVANENRMPPTFHASDFVLVAGGIGVTPLTGLARVLKLSGKPVRMIYSARTADDAAFVTELTELLGDDLELNFDDRHGRLAVTALIETVSPQTVLYMCGPQGLMDAVKAAWSERALPVQNLRYETFANSGNRPATAFEVTVAQSGTVLKVGPDESLLEALLASGHEALSGCLRGECGLCRVQISDVDGVVDHRDVFLSPDERADNTSMCACVSRLDGGSMTVSIDDVEHGRSP